MPKFQLFVQMFFKQMPIEPTVQVSDTTGLPKELLLVNKK